MRLKSGGMKGLSRTWKWAAVRSSICAFLVRWGGQPVVRQIPPFVSHSKKMGSQRRAVEVERQFVTFCLQAQALQRMPLQASRIQDSAPPAHIKCDYRMAVHVLSVVYATDALRVFQRERNGSVYQGNTTPASFSYRVFRPSETR